MRLLLLITDLELGGTPIVVRELATRLRSDDVHVEVACLKPAGIVGEQLKERGITVTSFDLDSIFQFGRARRALGHLIRERQIDTVLSFLMHANVLAASAAQRAPANVRFFQSVQTTQPKPRWHWWLQRRAIKRAAAVIVPTRSIAEKLRVTHSCHGPVVIPNAVDAPFFCGTGYQPVDHNHGLIARATRKMRVGFVGRLDPIKRVDVLIDAYKRLDANLFSLDIFGEGREGAALKTHAASMPGIAFHGMVADARNAYANIDVLVLPSDAEGFGLVLIEAMAAGVPVIGTNVDGIRDVIKDGETGLLVPPRDPAALAAAIRRLREDGALCERLIAAARIDVAARFAWPAVLDQYRAVLLPRPAAL